MRGGGIPVSWMNGISSLPVPVAREVRGGPASKGVRNAFSQEPDRGSPAGAEGRGAGVMTGGGG